MEKQGFGNYSLIYNYIARKVFKQLLLRVIERTHQDDLPDKLLLVFNKSEIEQQWTSLEMIGIDDPFQNMDDINVFSFIDVISQVVVHKQVMISNHNEDFVSLIKNKSGLEAKQIGYIHFKSYSRDQIDLETNCKVAVEGN